MKTSIDVAIIIIPVAIAVISIFSETQKTKSAWYKLQWKGIILLALSIMGLLAALANYCFSKQQDENREFAANKKHADLMREMIMRSDVLHSRFLVTIHTSTIKGELDAGTDRPVYARLHGENRFLGITNAVSEWVRLNGSGNDFKEGTDSSFSVRFNKIVESPNQIELRWYDNIQVKGDAGWEFTKIQVQDLKLTTNGVYGWAGSGKFTKNTDSKPATKTFYLTPNK